VYVVSPFSTVITKIDPNLLQVVQQIPLPQGLSGIELATLSSGAVMVLPALNGGGFAPVYLWDPVGNTFTGVGQSVLYFNPGMARSADHSRVLFWQGFSPAAVAAVYDVGSGQFTGPANLYGVGYVSISPDGEQLFGLSIQGTSNFYDANFNVTGSITLGLFPVYGTIYSLDGSRVYALGQDFAGAGSLVAAIDTSQYSLAGIVPAWEFGPEVLFSGQWPTALATDETNMLFGAVSQSMAFLDLSSPGSLGLPVPGVSRFQPTLVSQTSATQVALSGTEFLPQWSYGVFFGAPPASSQTRAAANVAIQSVNSLAMSAPSGLPAGPANVTATRSDGWFQILPDAVTYGPTILRVDGNAGSPQGGDSINITGYGLSGSNVQVLIGGNAAAITNVLSANYSSSQFPQEVLTVTTPSGSPGSADVVVQTPEGSATVPGGFVYANSAQIYPIPVVPGGGPDSIVYDQARQRLYLANFPYDRVEVFDLTTNSLLAPVSVGLQPTSLALTPDNAFLAVFNPGSDTVSVVDLTKMQVVRMWSAVLATEGSNYVPVSMVAGLPHRAFIDVYDTASLGGGSIHVLDLDTGAISCSGLSWCANGTDVSGFLRAAMASTPDGTKVFLAAITGGGGASPLAAGLLDLHANTLATGFAGECSDAAADADGTIFGASLAIGNAQMAQVSIMGYEPYTADARQQAVFGEKLNGSGSLLYFPHVQDVDLFDVHTGRLVERVMLPEALPGAINSLALDETGAKIFLISNSGLTIVQLPRLPLSLATVTPSSGATGTQIKLRGSGFQNGASVSFGAAQAAVTYVDANTLTAVVPSLPSGNVRVTVTNPGGATYSFDAAFTVQ
jgi:hypothetical protein